jgi:hypothetical protein
VVAAVGTDAFILEVVFGCVTRIVLYFLGTRLQGVDAFPAFVPLVCAIRSRHNLVIGFTEIVAIGTLGNNLAIRTVLAEFLAGAENVAVTTAGYRGYTQDNQDKLNDGSSIHLDPPFPRRKIN